MIAVNGQIVLLVIVAVVIVAAAYSRPARERGDR